MYSFPIFSVLFIVTFFSWSMFGLRKVWWEYALLMLCFCDLSIKVKPTSIRHTCFFKLKLSLNQPNRAEYPGFSYFGPFLYLRALMTSVSLNAHEPDYCNLF